MVRTIGEYRKGKPPFGSTVLAEGSQEEVLFEVDLVVNLKEGDWWSTPAAVSSLCLVGVSQAL